MSSSRDWLDFWSCHCNPFQWRWVYCVAGDGRVKYDLVLSLDKSYEIWFVTKRLQFKNVPRLSRAAAFEPWKTNVDGRPGTNEDWSTEYVAVRTISIGPVVAAGLLVIVIVIVTAVLLISGLLNTDTTRGSETRNNFTGVPHQTWTSGTDM